MSSPLRVDPREDPLLRDVPLIEGFKVLTPVVLYSKLGQGGMGAVYRGRHLKLDIDVAVKCLKPSLADESEEFVLRFAREAKLAASISHQNLVSVKDVDFRHGLHYLVMEFVAGENARERVQRKGPLAEREALAILAGATAGLAAAHRAGVVHRDIKPDNILISSAGEVKLSDLGLAKAAATQEAVPITRAVLGTPQYMAPEQWESMSLAGPPADVWALGATLYFLLTGSQGIPSGSLTAMSDKVRFTEFPDPRAVRPDVSPEVTALLARCVARDPAARFADARELLRELTRLVPDAEVTLESERGFAPTVVQPLVSPPPQQTLARIRMAVETPAQPLAADPGQTPAAPEPPRRKTRARSKPKSRPAPQPRQPQHRPEPEPQPQSPPPEPQPEAPAMEAASRPADHAPLGRALGLAGKVLTAVVLVAAIGWPLGLKDLVVDALAEWFRSAPADRPSGIKLDALRPPRIVVETPSAGATVLPMSRFAGVVTGQPPIQLTVGGVRAPLEGGRFGVSLGLRMGPQDVELVATDALGRRTVVQHRVTVKALAIPKDPARYLLTWAKPEPDAEWVPAEGVAYPRTVRDPRTDMVFVLVPAGTFEMGSALLQGQADEHPRHTVRLTRPFYLARCEVTVGQWRRFAQAQKYATTAEASGLDQSWKSPWPGASGPPTDQHPVTQVSWADAMAFCDHYGYRLPTEAEFEFANRAGSTALYPWGDDPAKGAGQANVADELAPPDSGKPARFPFRDGHAFLAPVGSFAPNAFGLCDLTGNANEWCQDWYDERFYQSAAARLEDPVNRTEGTFHVVRGGSAWSGPAGARAAQRSKDVPLGHSPDLGFRVAHDP